MESTSQLGADLWVLETFPNKIDGYFVDAGCGDGEVINNTFLLEKLGWKGICIDAFPINFTNRKNSIVLSALLYSEKDIEKTFLESSEPTLSGIVDNLGYWKNFVNNRPHNLKIMKTELLSDILDKNNAPTFIEYLSLDIEGAEYEVIKTFPYDKYIFGCISIEHNSEEPKRTYIRNILEQNGYIFIKEVKECDDWYKHSSVI